MSRPSENAELLNYTPNSPNGYGAASGRSEGRDAPHINVAGDEPSGQALYSRDVNRDAVQRARYLLLVVSVLCLLCIGGTLVGAVYAYSLCLVMNSTALMVMFSRVLFLAFLLQCAGRPTSRLNQYRRYKIELFLVLILLLLAWLVTGGALFLAIEDALKDTYGIDNALAFLITSAVLSVFALIVLGVMVYGQKVAPRHKPTKGQQALSMQNRSIVNDMPAYARERGLLLRRTLKHVPMQPHVFLTLWFLLQCLLALAGAILLWFYPSHEYVVMIDIVLAFAFVPLTIISSGMLLRDVLNVMSEGILQGLDFSEVVEALLSVDGVTRVTDLRIWALTMDRVSLSVLLTIERGADVEAVLNKASALLKSKYDIFEYKIDTTRERMGGQTAKQWPNLSRPY